MSKYSPAEARALYEELSDQTDIVGHANCGNRALELVLRFRERTSAVGNDYIAEEEPSADTDDGPPQLRFRVASPWHALIHLEVNNRGWLEGKQGPLRTPLIYRGQRDARWSLVPSLLRRDAHAEREEQRRLRFNRLVREALTARPDSTLPDLTDSEVVSDEVLEATAQHYGIRTRLLDFTSDAAVAVWFACHGGTRGDNASVFALPLAMGALFDVGVVLPHPLALRPYRQHGLFLRDTLHYLKRFLIEIRFPLDPDFEIRRDRLPTTPLPQDGWWETLMSESDRDPSTRPRVEPSHQQVRESYEESLLHLLQMLMELTTFDVERDPALNHNVIALIVKANRRMLQACESDLRALGRRHFQGTMGQYVVPRLLDRLGAA